MFVWLIYVLYVTVDTHRCFCVSEHVRVCMFAQPLLQMHWCFDYLLQEDNLLPAVEK